MGHIRITSDGEKEEFYGSFIFSWYAVGFFGPIAFVIWEAMHMYKDPRSGWGGVAALSPILLFPLLLGFQLFYFCLSDKSLEIRNHIFRWYRKEYRLTDIESVTFFTSGFRTARSLQVRRTALRPRLYFAGSLGAEDWYDLGKALRKKSVSVDDRSWGV